MVSPDHQDHQGKKGIQVQEVQRGRAGLLAREAARVFRENKANLAFRVHKVNAEIREGEDQKAHRGQLVPKEFLGVQVIQEGQAPRARKVRLAQKAIKAPTAKEDRLGRKAPRESEGYREPSAKSGQKET